MSSNARLLFGSLVCLSLAAASTLVGTRSGAAEGETLRPVVVRFRAGAVPDTVIDRLERRLAFSSTHRYRHALRGFAASLSPEQLDTLGHDPAVARIDPDPAVSLDDAEPRARSAGNRLPTVPKDIRRTQYVPTGVSWCGALDSPTAHIGSGGPSLDIGVAVIDTGIDGEHPDLNVVGGTSVRGGSYTDGNGHGTHVAGTIGAIDNGIGVVGVAPGCRLYAVRVLNSAGKGRISDLIAGLDWVLQHPADIGVVNMSVATPSSTDDTPFHDAVDACVAAGIPVVVAAGNNGSDARGFIPAAFDSVITVAALATFEATPGPSTGVYRIGGQDQLDQGFAFFSNYGPRIDLVAPGVSVLSTYKKHGYAIMSGTSMATPHVTGAVALYRIRHPRATPAEIKAALRAAGTYFSPPGDPDGDHDPALNVSSF